MASDESFELLDARGSLRFVADLVPEDDALCLPLRADLPRELRGPRSGRASQRPAQERVWAHAGRGGGGDGGMACVGAAGPGPAVARAALILEPFQDL
jgi:hypothetical protein